MQRINSIGKSIKIPSKNRDYEMTDEKHKMKGVKFTPAQIAALDEMSDNGIFKPIRQKDNDPDIVYEYPDFSAMVRALIADLYQQRFGKKFPDDMERGNPQFR